MMENLNAILGKRLSEVLANEKQEQTGRKLSVEQGTVSKWINGKQIPSPDILVKIADLYDVSLDWLLGLSEVKERSGLSSEKISYAQVLMVLDRLFRLANIEVLNFNDSADKNGSPVCGGTDTDYIKVNDRVLSYLLRRREIIYGLDDEDHRDLWISKCNAIFKDMTTMKYTDDVDAYIESKQTSTFKDGDWRSLIEEINSMSESELKNRTEKTRQGR